MSTKKKPEPRDDYRIQLSTGIAILNLPAKLTYQDKFRLKAMIDLVETARNPESVSYATEPLGSPFSATELKPKSGMEASE